MPRLFLTATIILFLFNSGNLLQTKTWYVRPDNSNSTEGKTLGQILQVIDRISTCQRIVLKFLPGVHTLSKEWGPKAEIQHLILKGTSCSKISIIRCSYTKKLVFPLLQVNLLTLVV